MSNTILPGAIGRMTAATANAATDDKIVAFDTSTGNAVTFTPDQIASGASAVDGPASATDDAIARFDGTTGKIIQDSVVTIANTTGNTAGMGTLGCDAITSTSTISGTTYTGTATTNQILLGTTNVTTISSVAPSSSQVLTIPDPGAAASFVMTEGAATINGVKTFGSIAELKATDAITAFSGGGQGSAVALTSQVNRITVCAADGDSVALPTAVPGQLIEVANIGATYADVFPISGDLIDSLSVDIAVSLPPGESIIFTCSVALKWKSTSIPQPGTSFVTGTTTTTFAADELTGGAFTIYNNTQGTPGSIATRTATLMFADDAYSRVGSSYMLRIINNQGTGTLTVTAGTGVTLTGTATIAVNTFRDFSVTYTSATALVIQQVGIGTDA